MNALMEFSVCRDSAFEQLQAASSGLRRDRVEAYSAPGERYGDDRTRPNAVHGVPLSSPVRWSKSVATAGFTKVTQNQEVRR